MHGDQRIQCSSCASSLPLLLPPLRSVQLTTHGVLCHCSRCPLPDSSFLTPKSDLFCVVSRIPRLVALLHCSVEQRTWLGSLDTRFHVIH